MGGRGGGGFAPTDISVIKMRKNTLRGTIVFCGASFVSLFCLGGVGGGGGVIAGMGRGVKLAVANF